MKAQDNFLDDIRQIILNGLKQYRVQVYLFGSQATGKAGPLSDVDVAVRPLEQIPPGVLSAIREQLEESNIPYSVDLMDLSQLNHKWLNSIKNSGILWTG